MSSTRPPTPYPIFRKSKIPPKDSEKCEKNDVVEYCKDMLQKSMLTGVPQIVTAPTLRSKIFKTFVVLGSFTGFLYQTSTFLMMYFSYPTLVDVQVTTPPFVDVPAVTICNRNGLKRKEYCSIKPENCGPSAFLDVFCQRYPESCQNGLVSGSDLFPKTSAFHEEVSATQEMIKQFGHQSYPLVYSCEFGEVNVTFDFCKNSTFKSFIFQDLYGRMKKCYILNALWSTATLNLPQVPTRATLKLVVDFEPEEYFRIEQTVTGQMAIHSPWNILNPFIEGFTLKPNKIYVVQVKEDIKNLLPYPYQTNCTDYIKAWKVRGWNGPLSKEMCIEECLLNQTMNNCMCVLPSNLYPHNFKFCGREAEDCMNKINYTHCFVKCSPACHDRNFGYSVKEEDVMSDSMELHSSKRNWNRTAMVLFIFKRTQVNMYKYRAKYESIELFSLLGGFVGIWLGVSLIALLDFLESLATFTVFLVDRFKANPRIASIRSAIGSRVSSRNNSVHSETSIPWARTDSSNHLRVDLRRGNY
ncbi:uncharacterized protein CDAR_221741 [Caerostris darwini]|uniref:Uncharacterized protein n=2 Tax=Caerostris darwini TaxID=1538125 RepID=A0AAV4TH92_9ARAC|nr:uncharacterized protein CDAR_221741 [Caerostris darwini]